MGGALLGGVKPESKGGRAGCCGWYSGRGCLGGCGTRLPGGDEGEAKVQWTFAPKNTCAMRRPGGRRGLI